MSKKINIILFLIISTLVISIVYIQSSFQHWSAQWDLDFWYIYNASLMSSGIQQEWYDHPATTILSFYSIFYKIYSLVDHSFIYKINEIMNSDDPNLVLQKLYFVTRIFDSINIILITLFTFKISKLLTSKDLYAYLLTSSLIFSLTFMNNLSILNPEDWATLFFLISFYYLLKFYNQNKIIDLILSGIFFSFSFYSKISVIFLFFFTILLIPLFSEIHTTKVKSNIQKIIEKKFSIIFTIYVISLLVYFFTQIFVLGKLDPFIQNKELDAIIIILINLVYMSLFLVISKFNLIKFKEYFSIFVIFFFGFCFGLLIFVLLDIFNIVNINPLVLVHLIKPFYKMLNFVSSEIPSSLVGNFETIILIIKKTFSEFKFDNFLFISLFIVFIISILNDFKNKKNNYLFIKLIIFSSLVFNTLVFNFRYWVEYLIYVHVLHIILLAICFQNVKKKLIDIFCVITLIYISIILPIKNFSDFERIVMTRESKLNQLCNNSDKNDVHSIFYFKIYSQQFTEDTYRKICKQFS